MHVLDLIIQDKEKVFLDDIFLDADSKSAVSQLIKEFRYADELARYHLPVSNKILLHGASGCGKTTTAKAIATALDVPIYVLNLSNFVSARIGETSQQLKMAIGHYCLLMSSIMWENSAARTIKTWAKCAGS